MWRWVFWIFVALYVAALGILAIGYFGSDQEPLSAAYLVILGLPWNVLADRAGIPGTWATIVAPALTAIILYALKRRFG